MTDESAAGELERLDSEAEPAARRFDEGPQLRGRIAVLPAAFNPPTLAHLGLLELAEDVPEVGGTAALLSTRNVDKGVHGASLEQRIDMLLAARERTRRYAVLATNMARLADQALALRRTFPSVDFDFVVGFDTLVRLFEPRYYDDMHATLREFLGRHRVIAANRGEAGLDAIEAFLAREEVVGYREAIVVVELGPGHAALSSTQARERATAGAAGSSIVPGAVARYITDSGLYRDGR